MPWSETLPMTERSRFIALHQEGLYAFAELCERFGVSRKTGYKWLARFTAAGLEGLRDQPRTPHACPQRTDPAVAQALLAVRQAHPTWGPKKLRAYLAPRRPALVLPAPSTIGALLPREGCIEPRRRRRHGKHPGTAPLRPQAPNEVWCADFKGQFPTGDGRDCYPLTVTDAYSRYLLACEALPSTRQEGVFPVFQRLFREYGVPAAMRTDNGCPFATSAIGGLSRLSVWWLQLGIMHQRIEPGRPEQNGRHERLHKTLKAETTRPPAATHPAQQVRFDAFRQEYNTERPHEALGGETPAAWYRPSGSTYPEGRVDPVYPGHFLVRGVSRAGNFRLHNRQIFVSLALTGERVGLEETDDGVWSVYYYEVLLGRLQQQDYRLRG